MEVMKEYKCCIYKNNNRYHVKKIEITYCRNKNYDYKYLNKIKKIYKYSVYFIGTNIDNKVNGSPRT